MACVKPYPHNQINADCISIIQFTERLISRVQFTLLKPYYFSLLGASLEADWNYEINDSLEIFKLLPECCFIGFKIKCLVFLSITFAPHRL